MYKRVGVVVEVDAEGVVTACSTTLMMVAASAFFERLLIGHNMLAAWRRSRPWSATATAVTPRARSSPRSPPEAFEAVDQVPAGARRGRQASAEHRAGRHRARARAPAPAPRASTAAPARCVWACGLHDVCAPSPAGTRGPPNRVTLDHSPRRYRWSCGGARGDRRRHLAHGSAAAGEPRRRGRLPAWRVPTWCSPVPVRSAVRRPDLAPSARAGERRSRAVSCTPASPPTTTSHHDAVTNDLGLVLVAGGEHATSLRTGSAPPVLTTRRQMPWTAGRTLVIHRWVT